tara:strand:+ start:6037 stop:6282 length:246 start_codon:yes stop_codon:yes gene_type:complete
METITVHIYTAGIRHYAMSYEKNVNILPEGYDWKHIETRTYTLNDNRFTLLPASSNEIKDEIDKNGYIHFDFTDLFEQNRN